MSPTSYQAAPPRKSRLTGHLQPVKSAETSATPITAPRNTRTTACDLEHPFETSQHPSYPALHLIMMQVSAAPQAAGNVIGIENGCLCTTPDYAGQPGRLPRRASVLGRVTSRERRQRFRTDKLYSIHQCQSEQSDRAVSQDVTLSLTPDTAPAHIKNNYQRLIQQQLDRNRRNDPHRLIYRTAAWARVRKAILARDPLCQIAVLCVRKYGTALPRRRGRPHHSATHRRR